MADGFDAFREALSAFLGVSQYLGLALYVGIEEVGIPFPVPADTLIVLMGYQVSRGEANPLLVLVVTVGSATMGASIQYWLGRYFGTRLINRLRGVFRLSHERQRRIEVWIRRYQFWAVILLRLVPGFRVILTLVCGVSRVDFRLFVPSVAISATIWASVFMSLGWALGDEYELLVATVEDNASIGIGIAVVVGVVLLAIGLFQLQGRIFRRAGRRTRATPPPVGSPATTPPGTRDAPERPPASRD